MRTFWLRWTALVGLVTAAACVGCSKETFPGDISTGTGTGGTGGIGGNTGGTGGGTGGAGGCVMAVDCPDDKDPCTDAVCTNGKCSAVAGNDNAPCGSDPPKTHCEGGVCIGCDEDADCDAMTECKTWTCSAKKECIAANGPTRLFLDPTGDCTERSCSADGVLVKVANLNDVEADDSNECTQEECLGIEMPSHTALVGNDCDGLNGKPTCTNGLSKTQSKCNALGNCDPGTLTPCNTFLCGETQCKVTCISGPDDCAAGNYCDSDHNCVKKKDMGSGCDSPSECSNQLACADGLCCNYDCTEKCFSCELGNNLGMCVPLPKGVVDGCASGTACNNGSCVTLGSGSNEKKAVGQPCDENQDCFNNRCIDELCRLEIGTTCESKYTVECQHNLCKDGICGQCTLDTDCPGATGKCGPGNRCQLPNGNKCGYAGDCISGICTAYVCTAP